MTTSQKIAKTKKRNNSSQAGAKFSANSLAANGVATRVETADGEATRAAARAVARNADDGAAGETNLTESGIDAMLLYGGTRVN